MQTASSSISTLVTVSIFYDGNLYTKITFYTYISFKINSSTRDLFIIIDFVLKRVSNSLLSSENRS